MYRGLFAAFYPVLCRRSEITQCLSMTFRAVGDGSVFFILPKLSLHPHTWLMCMAGFPMALLSNCIIIIILIIIIICRRHTNSNCVSSTLTSVHHFLKTWQLSGENPGWRTSKTVKCLLFFTLKLPLTEEERRRGKKHTHQSGRCVWFLSGSWNM